MSSHRKAAGFALVAAALLAALIPCACGGSPDGNPATPTATATPTPSPAATAALDNGVEVVYFHRAQRCTTCMHAESVVTYTVETYFSDEVASGSLVYMVLNVNDPVNSAMSEKFGAYGSSLFLNDVEGGVEEIEYVNEIWFLLEDEEAAIAMVKDVIEEHLGD